MHLNLQTKILITLFLIAFLIRLPGLFHVAVMDELGWLSWQDWFNWHPPISILLHTLLRSILGSSVWVSKLLMLMFGLANIVLVYHLAQEVYSKKAAIISAIIMTLGAYPILASLMIDIDGSILLFFYLLTAFCFLRYENTSSKKWLMLTGVSFGFAVLTKYPGVFILGILGLYHLFKGRKVIETIKVFLPITLIGVAMFLVFPIVSYLTGSPFFSDTLNHLSVYVTGGKLNLVLLLIQFLIPILWMGPLFIGLFFVSLTKVKKKDLLALIWIFVIIVFYIFFNKDNFKPVDKYFMILISPISMVVGNYLSKFKFNKKHLLMFGTLFVAFFTALTLLNSQTGDFLPFYPKTGFVERAFSVNWNFFLPLTGSSGPIGFHLMFSTVAYTFIISGLLVLILLYLSYKKDITWYKVFLVCLLALAFAYSTFVAQEYLLTTTTPSVNKVSSEVLEYANNNMLEKPIYVFRNEAFKYYLRERYGEVQQINFNYEFDSDKINTMTENPGTVIVVDFPTINKESLLWEYLKSCELLQSFEDKGVTMGYIFDCRGLR